MTDLAAYDVVDLPPNPAWLYRFYDSDDALLYVGITVRLNDRLNDHRRGSAWFADAVRVTVEQHPDERSARSAEREAIRAEHPRWNVQGNPTRPPRRGDDDAARLPNAREAQSGPRVEQRAAPDRVAAILNAHTYRLAYSMTEAAAMAGVSRGTLYEAAHAGRITLRKIGRRTVIRRDDLIRYLAVAAR